MSKMSYYSRGLGGEDPNVMAVHLLHHSGKIRIYTGSRDNVMDGYSELDTEEAVKVAEALQEAVNDLIKKKQLEPLEVLNLGAVVAFGDNYADQVVFEKRVNGWWAEVGSTRDASTEDVVGLMSGAEPRILFEGFEGPEHDYDEPEDEY